MRKKSTVSVAMVIAFAAIVSLTTQSAFAATPTNSTRPGNGQGDKNHHHVGPPGHSVRPPDGDGDGDDNGGNGGSFTLSFGDHNVFYGLENFFHNFFIRFG